MPVVIDIRRFPGRTPEEANTSWLEGEAVSPEEWLAAVAVVSGARTLPDSVNAPIVGRNPSTGEKIVVKGSPYGQTEVYFPDEDRWHVAMIDDSFKFRAEDDPVYLCACRIACALGAYLVCEGVTDPADHLRKHGESVPARL